MNTLSASAITPHCIFVSKMYEETFKLLQDAHNYFNYTTPDKQADYTPLERLVYSAEMSRVTLRLSSIMAWLMARRAEVSGRISREEALKQFRLAFNDICLQQLPEMHVVLPSAMCDLLQRSFSLYKRAFRLDCMVNGEPEAPLAAAVH